MMNDKLCFVVWVPIREHKAYRGRTQPPTELNKGPASIITPLSAKITHDPPISRRSLGGARTSRIPQPKPLPPPLTLCMVHGSNPPKGNRKEATLGTPLKARLQVTPRTLAVRRQLPGRACGGDLLCTVTALVRTQEKDAPHTKNNKIKYENARARSRHTRPPNGAHRAAYLEFFPVPFALGKHKILLFFPCLRAASYVRAEATVPLQRQLLRRLGKGEKQNNNDRTKPMQILQADGLRVKQYDRQRYQHSAVPPRTNATKPLLSRKAPGTAEKSTAKSSSTTINHYTYHHVKRRLWRLAKRASKTRKSSPTPLEPPTTTIITTHHAR